MVNNRVALHQHEADIGYGHETPVNARSRAVICLGLRRSHTAVPAKSAVWTSLKPSGSLKRSKATIAKGEAPGLACERALVLHMPSKRPA